jgi:DNA-binding MarR family transcriptional regulator
MPIINQLVELTHEELQLMVQNLDSKDVVSNPLERFIIYSSIIAAEEGSKINIKYIQAQSHQSFYRCSQAVKKLIKDDWISESINKKDKRNKDLLPTKKSSQLVKAYEGARANSFIQKGVKLPKPKINLTIKDMFDANESQLQKIKEDLLKS